MAWPPTIPPATRQNATQELDAHPSDHNLISDALTALVAQVNTLSHGAVLANGQRVTGDVVYSTTGARDILTFSPPIQPVTTTLFLEAQVWFGFASGFVNATAGLSQPSGANLMAAPGIMQAIAGAWACIPLAVPWGPLAPGADPSFKLAVNPQQIQSGSAHFDCRVMWWQVAS